MALDNAAGSKKTKPMARQVATLIVGILIGFVLGISSTLLVSWSHKSLLQADGIKSLSHPRDRRLMEYSGIAKMTRKSKEDDKGWKDIHVFYGDNSHMYDATELSAPYFQINKWFSQYRQDEIVSKLLGGKREGYFIDLAANDPVRISNTYALETNFDWKGLCLEPNPIYWAGLSYRKCDVVAAIVGNTTMEEVTFRFPRSKAPKGGIVGDAFDNKKDIWNEGHPRFTVSLLEVFKKFNVPKIIDYISLDVEGAEDMVIAFFPFSKYRFNVMTIERPSDFVANILTQNGYVLLKSLKNMGETLWVHDSVLGTVDISALGIDSENYKYRDTTGRVRVIPEGKGFLENKKLKS